MEIALPIAGPVLDGRFIDKRNRFVARVEVAGAIVEAHVPTSSRMRELLTPGARVLVADRRHALRATPFDLLMTYYGDTLVSVDSRVPNRLLDRLLRAGALPPFAEWTYQRPEVTLGESRLDFLLARDGRRCWIEAKSVTLVEDGVARFPDAPTARGARHLGELTAAREAGDRAAAVFVIQRADAAVFTPNRPLDPHFADTLADARRRGVEVYAFATVVTPEAIMLGPAVPVRL
jgi:sugar fermentation stimulation protein A